MGERNRTAASKQALRFLGSFQTGIFPKRTGDNGGEVYGMLNR